MEHESIVTMHHYFYDQKYIYIVMEVCEGGDFLKMLKYVAIKLFNTNSSKKIVSEEQCKKYTRQIVTAMIYLQSMGIIHRDLKLSNILLTKDDNIVRITRNNTHIRKYATLGCLSNSIQKVKSETQC